MDAQSLPKVQMPNHDNFVPAMPVWPPNPKKPSGTDRDLNSGAAGAASGRLADAGPKHRAAWLQRGVSHQAPTRSTTLPSDIIDIQGLIASRILSNEFCCYQVRSQ